MLLLFRGLLTQSHDPAAAPDRIPRWTMPLADQPNFSLPLNGTLPAGLKLTPGTAHVTVFEPSHTACCTTAIPPCPRSTECLGTYNHAPLISRIGGSVLMMGWHNGEFDEDSPGGRVLASHSHDGHRWAPAAVLFDSLPGSSSTTSDSLSDSSSSATSVSGIAAPFCVLDTATGSGNWYIKTGGEASIKCGWDGGTNDKCCRRVPNDCRWFRNDTNGTGLAHCTAALAVAADPSSHYCLPCGGETNNGCPMTFVPGPPPPPPVPNVGLTGTNLYMSGFVSLGGSPARQYAVASGYVGTVSASCRTSAQHGTCGPTAGCCSKALGCCSCLKRQKLPELMRRVSVTADGDLTLGRAFWSSVDPLPAWTPHSTVAPLKEMDADTQADAATFLTQRLLQVTPRPPKPLVLSERSFFLQRLQSAELEALGGGGGGGGGGGQQAETARLAMLIRDDGTPSSLRMWASLCDLPNTTTGDLARMERASANGELLLTPVASTQCNWSAVTETNIPDSRSKTCAGALPPAADGQRLRYLLGNQLPKVWDRDPLTISLSPDGVEFGCVLAVRADSGREFFPGFGKGPGYQYPAAAVVGDALLVAYSINKEAIGVTHVPLSSLVCE